MRGHRPPTGGLGASARVLLIGFLQYTIKRRLRGQVHPAVRQRRHNLVRGHAGKACKIMGYSRQQFYEIRRNFQTHGAAGLLDKLPGARGPHPNRVSPEVEQAILDYCLTQPTHGPLRVAQELALRGLAPEVWLNPERSREPSEVLQVA